MLRFFTLLITASLCLQIGNQCKAQDVNRVIKKGIKELENKHDVLAYNYFLDALYLDPENKKAKLYAGVCHLHLQSPQKALEYLLEVKNSKEAQQLAEFPAYLAMAYHLNLDFENALEITKNLEDSLPTTMVDVVQIKSNIQNAIAEYKDKKSYTVINMGGLINTRQHEYGTAAFSDHQTFLYTSRPELWDRDTLQNKRKLYENIYTAELDSNFNWKEPHFFTNPHLKGNDAVIQIFDNDTKMLTYHNGDLLISQKDRDYWEKGSDIKGINTPANESHGYISKDGKTIYFASNFETHDGNLNLYVSNKQGDTWSEPKELTGLNTPYDEDAPFIGDDGYLYFSSKGHSSIGNYDIFRSKFDENKKTWSEPENLGVPINSVFDDLYYTTYGRLSYFSSLRTGGNGGMDLYKMLPFNEIEVSGIITEEGTGEVLANSTQQLQFGDKNFKVRTDSNGKYTLKVPLSESNNFHVAKNDANEEILIFHFGDSSSSQKSLSIPLDRFSSEIPKSKLNSSSKKTDEEENLTNQTIIAKEEKSKEPYQAISKEERLNNNQDSTPPDKEIAISSGLKNQESLNNNNDNVENNLLVNNATIQKIKSGKAANLYLYFDNGASIINEVFYQGLDEIASFLQSDESLIIEVGGHTDSIGSNENNQRLSERRAKSVALYLIERGIDKSRVIAKGYGESLPIASNDDEKEGRELNRRVEIKKIEAQQISSLSE